MVGGWNNSEEASILDQGSPSACQSPLVPVTYPPHWHDASALPISLATATVPSERSYLGVTQTSHLPPLPHFVLDSAC